MKKLSELYNCNFDIPINDIKTNSKEVKPGDLFVCIKGVSTNRHDFISEAINNGACALIVEQEGNYKVPYIKVENANNELALLSKKFYDNPLDKLNLIGITGTDGKTTTASIIRNMLGNNLCGYIGTNGIYCLNEKQQEQNTTPDINKIYKYLNYFVKKNLKYATMEISSEALYRNRTNSLNLDVAILTNITEDHLDVHKTIENYIESKEKIFNLLKKNGVAIINRDDKYYNEISKVIDKKILTFGENKESDLILENIKEFSTGTIFNIIYKKNKYRILSPLIGKFNAYNIAAALLTLLHFGYSIEDSIEKITQISRVDGRCEMLSLPLKYNVVLDYAHTPNALKNILTYLNTIKKRKIITVVGSAGGREKQKRKDMGNIVLKLSDLVIFTMDDPRNEKVDEIIDDMLSNTNNENYIRIIDREQAINYALKIAKKDDIVLIAGKGRDNYMAIKDKYIKYSDYDIIKNFVDKM